MPMDPSKAVGTKLKDSEFSWNPDKLILYALGVGVGVGQDPCDKKKVLQYAYENGLKALPTYGVMPVFAGMGGIMGLPGLSFNPMMLLHGEQYTEILSPPFPVTGTIVNEGVVTGVFDKGKDEATGKAKGAVITIEFNSKDKNTGKPFLKNIFSAFIRGEGGFAKPGDPKAPEPGNQAPGRAPDAVVEYPTMTHQAILYRLSGDKNPLHIDPMMAKMGKFDKPILHGLCTFGNVGRAAIEAFADNNPEKFKSIKVRFAAPVYPGETIVVKMWKESGTKVLCEAFVKERDMLKVISNAAVSFTS